MMHNVRSASNPIPSPTMNATKTAVAIAAVTATAAQAQENAAATAEAARLDATSTAQAKVESANATATQKAYDNLATTPPTGQFSATGQDAVVLTSVDSYRNSISYFSAGKGNKYIVLGVGVRNTGSSTLSVNPYNFTLVSTTGETVPHDIATYSFSDSLQAVDLRPDAYTTGSIVFEVSKSFIPGKLVWDVSFGFGEVLEVTIVAPR